MRLRKNGHLQRHEAVYEIRVEGQLSAEWSDWFEGLAIRQEVNPESGLITTVLSGLIPDQPALYGILNIIRDLNLKLISVITLSGNTPANRGEN
jgi:hypothetical protein